ncbi:MAG: helix-turn-helix transcriptional regulator [Bacteroidetes bacterium]|nr:helix-turn-helix transcriptional regulator [Bacteroidota bacterium]
MDALFFEEAIKSIDFANKIESNLLGFSIFKRYNCIKLLNLNLLKYKQPVIVFIDYDTFLVNVENYNGLNIKHYFICFGNKIPITDIVKIKQYYVYAYFDYEVPVLEILQMIFELKTGKPYLSINNIISQVINNTVEIKNTEIFEIIKTSNEPLEYKLLHSKLTKREIIIFDLLLKKESILNISSILDLEYNYVNFKCRSIYKKFYVKTKNELLFKMKNIFNIKEPHLNNN